MIHGGWTAVADEETTMSTTIRRAAAFWSASLFGFAAWGALAARLAAGALGEGSAAEGVETALVLGVVAAIVVGGPAALLFAVVMRSAAASWRTAIRTGLALAVVVALPLRAVAAALPGDDAAGGPAYFVVLAALAMFAGAVAGFAAVGRGVPAAAPAQAPATRRCA
jgi:hypothetical protein